jgi:putative transposase
MSFVQIWVHGVWGTKNREPVLQKSIREKVRLHILENAKTKNIYIDCINGYTEHLHCLMTLNTELSISKQMQLIKGESSFWVNKTNY